MDEGCEFKGVKFFGTHWSPVPSTRQFYTSDRDLARVWCAVPSDTDVLTKQNPPFDFLAVPSWGMSLGCSNLAKALARIGPKYHCFGHVHNSAGILEGDGVTFINPSSVNSDLEIA